MTVRFASRTLERCYVSSALALRRYGQVVGRRYIQRINIIKHVKSPAELIALPGLHCHALKGNLSGRHTILLTGQVRLIVSIRDDFATIEEVSKHYD
ncbi:MAG: plasmid maintenance system killer [Candidatus Eremiobacter antarcticus]|nr:type II toxin-antitoxin system RelE/ParE family toxin [Candidatus Eremiobacteraeota bacterium]PZR62328.1 MAG: plasmid maintenance system killer [Candidatus Eremiobacter sp. RRmetagenome_bin22]